MESQRTMLLCRLRARGWRIAFDATCESPVVIDGDVIRYRLDAFPEEIVRAVFRSVAAAEEEERAASEITQVTGRAHNTEALQDVMNGSLEHR